MHDRPPIDNDQLAAEYRAGAGLHALAAKYQRCYTAIRMRLDRIGQERRPRGAPKGNTHRKGKTR